VALLSPALPNTSVFIDAIEALSPEAFLRHFMSGAGAAAPDLPAPTPAALANARQVLDNRFELVGETHVLPDGFSWTRNPSHDLEWQIAQHKFYFAVDLIHAYRRERDPAYLTKWVSLLESWLDEMSSGFITASDAQVEAKRLEHWVYSLLLLRGTPYAEVVTPHFLRRMLERIATETWYITQHLKPVRNHRTFQLWTVFLVGVLFPEFRRHAFFVETGRDLLTANLLTDFLTDGVHVELSTHYHQLALETGLAFVDLAGRNGIAVDPALLERLARAARFSMAMQWPDGSIPLINDSDDGDHRGMLRQASRLFGDPELLWAATLGREGKPPDRAAAHFDQAGYFVFCDGWGQDAPSYARRQHVFYDCARLGEGSHSHYDLFSFTYFCDGQPAVVDPGRFTYSPRPDADGIDWRQVFKSTAAHNTVGIDGRDQTRYISKLAPRVSGASKHGPEVQIEDRDFHLGQRTDWVVATARSAEYAPRHQRLFLYVRHEYLLILDHVLTDDAAAHESVFRLHLPDACLGHTTLDRLTDQIVARSPRTHVHTAAMPGLAASIEQGWVSTAYGLKSPAPVVRLSQTSAEPVVFCSVVAPPSPEPAGLVVHSCRRLETANQAVWLFRIDGTHGGTPFADFLLFHAPGPLTTVELDGVRFRGHFLFWSYAPDGRLEHVVARGAQTVQFASGHEPLLPPVGDHVEWSASA
jgi:Heparinase II/III N-terminus/Heparinase II/III-like protein